MRRGLFWRPGESTPPAFPRSFEKRLNTDYADFSAVTPEEAARLRSEVAGFVDACAELLDRILRLPAGPE